MTKVLINPARESLKKIESIKRLSFLVCLAVNVNVSKRITNAQGRKRYTTEFVEEGTLCKSAPVVGREGASTGFSSCDFVDSWSRSCPVHRAARNDVKKKACYFCATTHTSLVRI